MAGYGVPEIDIARVIGIDPKTLRKHYRDELDTGHILANAKVAESLFRKATGDGRQSVTAAIFWLKVRAGWCETKIEQLPGDRVQARIEAMSDAELDAAIAEFTAKYEQMTAEQKASD